jgi:hypothetical protein
MPKSQHKAKDKYLFDPTSLFSYGVLPTNPHKLAKWESRDDLRAFTKNKAQVGCGATTYGTLKWVTQDGYTYLSGVAKCKSSNSCPNCTTQKMAVRRTELKIKGIQTVDAGGSEVYGTLTISPTNPSNLSDCYRELLNAGMRFRRAIKPIEKKLGITYSTRILEETYSENTHWHPHFNYVWHVPTQLTQQEETWFASEVISRWVESAHQVGAVGTAAHVQTVEYVIDSNQVTERAEYVTKHAYYPSAPSVKLSGKYEGLEPFEVLELARLGETKWIDVWNDFELAAKRKHRVVHYRPKVPKASK